LYDQFGRRVDYIRLSITDRCDFRCVYCMSEDMTFLPRDEVLSLEECARLVRIFVGLGVGKVRITGGEPLVRKNALWLFEQIGRLQGLRELVVTTNGSQLESQAADLKAAGVKRINISLDSLDTERFRRITRVGDLQKVLRGIAAAKAAGFDNIKLNTVLMRAWHQRRRNAEPAAVRHRSSTGHRLHRGDAAGRGRSSARFHLCQQRSDAAIAAAASHTGQQR